ncbi:MAG: hypothetical protein EP330_11575 [Deltaproteobacteria bacterium]|nr:MAG: hypothetical protein EP330_11575 [Deltaproteobacteria bacterium]
MSPQLAIVLSAATLAVGVAIGLVARPPAPEPSLFVQATDEAPTVDPCVTMADALARDLGEARSDLAALSLTLPMAEARARQHGALPHDWPEDLDEAYRESGLRRILDNLADSELVELDCSEFPCVFAIRDHAPLDHTGTPGPEASPSFAALADLDCGPTWTTQRFVDDEGDSFLTTITSCGAGDDPDVRARADQRVRDLAASLGRS